MTAQRLRICASTLLLAGAIAFACGQRQGAAPAGMGQLSVAMVDAPTEAVSEIWVNVTQVRAHSVEAGWVTVSTTPVTVDLLTLQSAAADLGLINLPPGTITQVRLLVAPTGNYVVLNNAQIPLKVPSGTESGIKIKGPWTIAACAQTALTLDFDGKHSLFVHPALQGDEWILRPVIRVKKVTTTDVGCTDGGGSDGGTPGACDEANPCPEGLTCTNGTCGGGDAGAPCVLNSECISNVCAASLCAPGSPGTPCTAGGSCQSGVCDAGTSTCAPGGPGTPCSLPGDCASGVCQADGTCGAGSSGGAGSPCAAPTECLSNSCSNDVCDQGGQGAPCTVDGDCTTGLTCIENACLPAAPSL